MSYLKALQKLKLSEDQLKGRVPPTEVAPPHNPLSALARLALPEQVEDPPQKQYTLPPMETTSLAGGSGREMVEQPSMIQQKLGKLASPPDSPLLTGSAESAPIQPEVSGVMAPLSKIAPYTPPVEGAVPAQTESQRIMEKLRGIQNKDYSKAEYDDAGNMIKPAGPDRDKHWSTLDKIGSGVLGALRGFASGGGLLGAATGAISAGTNRNYMEQLKDEREKSRLAPLYKLALQDEEDQAKLGLTKAQTADVNSRPEREKEKTRQKVEAAALAHQRRMQYLDQQQKFEGGQWARYEDEDGKVWKQYKDGRLEPVMFNGEQDINPAKVTYDVYDPVTQQTVKATGAQILGYSAPIQQGNATRAQQTEIHNADKAWETMKTNIANDMKYQDDVRTQINSALAAEGVGTPELTALQTEAEAKRAKYQEIGSKDMSGASEEEKAQQVKALDKLANEVDELNGKIVGAMQKTEAGKVRAEQLRANMPKRPAKLTYAPVKAVQIQGKAVPKAKDPLGLYQ